MSTWPDYFPAACPPAEARHDNVQVFRLVSVVPPAPDDFLPTLVEQPHRPFEAHQLCNACGVSVFRNVKDALKKRARFAPLRDKKVARGQITPTDGLVLETGQPSHMTWWLQTEAPHTSFKEHQDAPP